MTTTPLTASMDEAVILDNVEQILIRDWSTDLTTGHSPRFIVALIEAAVDYDPRLGLAMDVCERHGCSVFVDENARDSRGHLYCSDGCRDDDSHTAEQRAHAAHTARLADDEHDDGSTVDGYRWDPAYGWRRAA